MDRPIHWIALVVPLLIGLYLFLTSTMDVSAGFHVYDVKRMVELSLLPVIFTIILLKPDLRKAYATQVLRCPRWMVILLIAMFILGLASSAINADSGMHFAYSLGHVLLGTGLLLAIPAIAACREAAGRRFDQVALALIFLTTLAVGFIELTGVLAAYVNGTEYSFQMSLIYFSFPRFYNHIQTWSLPLLAALPLIFGRKPLVLTGCIVVIGLQWFIIMVTGARGSMVALIAAIAISTLLFSTSRRELVKWQLSGVLLGSILYAALVLSYSVDFQAQAPSAAKPGVKAPASPVTQDKAADSWKPQRENFHKGGMGRPLLTTRGRTWFWKWSVRDVREHPILGSGPANYACEGTERQPASPHSLFFQILGEWGIPVTIGFMIIMIYLMWRMLKYSSLINRESHTTLSGIAPFIATGVLAAGIHSTVSGVHITPASQLTGILMCGWLLALIPRNTAGEERRHHPSLKFLTSLPVIGLLLSLLLFSGAAREFPRLEQRSMQMPPGTPLHPRFWQDGKICSLFTETGTH